MKGTYFITGTDTEIGKSYVTAYLLKKYGAEGLKTVGFKPVAAGSENGVNEDAVLMQQHATVQLPLDTINPFCFNTPCSPHIAAAIDGYELQLDEMVDAIKHSLTIDADLRLIEGAGGWYVPLSDTFTWKDVLLALDMPVIFVVGMRLGCLNHAMLTERALLADGIKVAGWIANQLSPDMPYYTENLHTLKNSLKTPCLEEVGFSA